MTDTTTLIADTNQELDRLEAGMLEHAPAVDLPLVHRFLPGLYVRQIFMPAGTLLTSKIHRTEHPYVVTQGRVSVFIPGQGIEHIEAPYFGVTTPGTRRLLYIHEDTTWLTFHPNPDDETDLAEIEERLIEKRALPNGESIFELYQRELARQSLPPEEPAADAMPGQYEYGGAP